MSDPASVDALRDAVEALHACTAVFREAVTVVETWEGRTAWEGTVHVFDVGGIDETETCYAWSSPVEGSDNRKIYAVLAVPPVVTPGDAVRASIISDSKGD